MSAGEKGVTLDQAFDYPNAEAVEFLTRSDPFDRFLKALDGENRVFADEVVALRREFEIHVSRLLLVHDLGEAHRSAEWVRDHVLDVTRTWGMLMYYYKRWSLRDCPPIELRVRR